jgi:hypothetical protein
MLAGTKVIGMNKICCRVETFSDEVKATPVPKLFEPVFHNHKVLRFAVYPKSLVFVRCSFCLWRCPKFSAMRFADVPVFSVKVVTTTAAA